MASIVVDVPEELVLALEAAGVSTADLGVRARRNLAVDLYLDGRLSLGKAARLAGSARPSFWQLLVDQGHPVFDYSERDLALDRRALDKFAASDAPP